MRSRIAVATGLALVATAFALSASEPTAVERAIPARLAAQSLLLDGAVRGALAIAVGERGHVLISRDRGKSWQQAEVPSRAMLTGVYLHDERLGWAVGHDETILRTRDGGATWELLHHAPESERPLLDVWFRDAERGLAVGAYGTVLATSDGGATWEEQPLGEDDFHLNQISAAADGTLYLAAEAGHLYRSRDGGATWQTLASPYEGSFFGVLPLSGSSVLAFGLRGHLYRSDDRGESWRSLETGSEATLVGGIDLGNGSVMIAGLAGVLLTSQDGGASFRLRTFDDRRAHVAAIAVEGELLLLGEGGARRLEEAR